MIALSEEVLGRSLPGAIGRLGSLTDWLLVSLVEDGSAFLDSHSHETESFATDASCADSSGRIIARRGVETGIAHLGGDSTRLGRLAEAERIAIELDTTRGPEGLAPTTGTSLGAENGLADRAYVGDPKIVKPDPSALLARLRPMPPSRDTSTYPSVAAPVRAKGPHQVREAEPGAPAPLSSGGGQREASHGQGSLPIPMACVRRGPESIDGGETTPCEGTVGGETRDRRGALAGVQSTFFLDTDVVRRLRFLRGAPAPSSARRAAAS